MADSTTKLIVRFLADTREIVQATKGIEGTGNQLKSWAKGVGVAIAGAFAVDKVIDFTKQAISAASDLEESASKVGVVFGDSGEVVKDWAKTAATSMGVSEQAALEAAGTFGNLGVGMGIATDDAADISQAMVQLAADMASFNNVPVEEALAAIKSGLTGESEPMKKFGVVLDEATLKANAFAKGIGDGKRPLTAQEKYLAAYREMVKQTGIQQGDFTRTSEGLAGQQKIAAAQWDDMQASIGEALLPVIKELVTVANTYLIPVLKTVAEFVSQNSGWLLPLAGIIGGIVLAIKAWSLAQAALNIVMSANPIMLVVIAIAALVAGIIWAYQNVEWFRDLIDGLADVFQGAFDIILSVVQFVWDWIVDNWPLLLAVITGPIGIAVWTIQNYWDQILAAIQFVWNWVKDNWDLLLAIITGPFGLAVAAVRRYWDEIWGVISGVYTKIKDGITSAASWIGEKNDQIIGFFTSIPRRIASGAKGMFDGIANAFITAINTMISVWNGLELTIGGWDPPGPGPSFPGFTLGVPDIPKIPYLAAGAYVTSPMLAMIGEGRQPEVVSPVDQLRRIVGEEARVSVRVFIGDRELTDIVRVELGRHDDDLAAAVARSAW